MLIICTTERRSHVSLAKEHSTFNPDIRTSTYLEPGRALGAESIAMWRLCGGVFEGGLPGLRDTFSHIGCLLKAWVLPSWCFKWCQKDSGVNYFSTTQAWSLLP